MDDGWHFPSWRRSAHGSWDLVGKTPWKKPFGWDVPLILAVLKRDYVSIRGNIPILRVYFGFWAEGKLEV